MNQPATIHRTRLLGLLLALCALLALAGTAAAQDSSDSARAGQLYTVEAGDELAAIAANFDVTTTCLLAANDIADPDDLEVGAEIVVPSDCSLFEQGGGAVDAMAMSAADVEYTVRPGDRLTRIARAYNTSVACIAQANGILNPDLIYIGQVLVIPGDCQDSGGGEAGVIVGNGLCQFDPYPGRRAVGGQYVVPFADMLDFIGCDFNVQTSCLADANGLGATPRLTLGQTLFIDQSCPPWQAWPGTGTGRGAN